MKQLATAVTLLGLIASASAQSEPGVDIAFSGSQPSAAGSAQNFTGRVRLDMSFRAEPPGRAGGALVTFEPSARTAWHTHPAGQILIVTQGLGLVQRWGGPVQEIRAGDVVRILPGEKHWHGASPTNAMSHIAIGELINGKSVDWLEKVSDTQYPSPTVNTGETR